MCNYHDALNLKPMMKNKTTFEQFIATILIYGKAFDNPTLNGYVANCLLRCLIQTKYYYEAAYLANLRISNFL